MPLVTSQHRRTLQCLGMFWQWEEKVSRSLCLCQQSKRHRRGHEPESGTRAGTSKPAGKIVKIDQIPPQGSFPAVFPHHCKTRFRPIKESRGDVN